MMKKTTTLAILLAATLVPAAAGERIDKHLSASRDGLVTIENVAGSVRVTGWDRDEVELTGTLGKETEELVFTNTGNRTTIRVELPEHTRDVEGSDLVVKVPRSSRLEINVVSASANVADLDGELKVESVSGNVDAMGTITDAEISTVSGTIQLSTDGTLSRGSFKSVSGKIDVGGDLGTSGRYQFETVSGNVDLRLPRRSSAEFDLSSFSGNITNDFGEKPARTSEYLPSQELKFSVGSGGARVFVKTLSGSIHLRSE